MDIKLANTAAERERYDVEADIYSLLLATESLEKLYIRDLVSADEYQIQVVVVTSSIIIGIRRHVKR